ncbi:MAG: hypothetical protein J7J32_01620 [Candidatus Atribacteria bacterium]|nr:hypothetical protein [Candidatus Atribacteria bacterium]MCD6350360.1 hypothetical protein [Candidatus Atribacteria bacterium]
MKGVEMDRISPSEVILERSKFSIEKQRERLQEACQEFEAFLLSFIFRKAMQPVFTDREFPFLGREETWFREMWLDEVCKKSCASANLQIGEMLYRSLELFSSSEKC